MHQKQLWKEYKYIAYTYSPSSILSNAGPKLLRYLSF